MSGSYNNDADVELYTDGACSGNPGPGGWAFVMRHPTSGRNMERAGAAWDTTNNRMELQAVIEGLKRLKRPTRIHIVTDSAYVMNGVMEWMAGWKSRGWKRKTSNGLKPVKNVDLWQELDYLQSTHDISFERVKGHSGHPENERCDELAVAAYTELVAEDR